MNDGTFAQDPELSAIQCIYSALEPMDDSARSRVINYVTKRLGIESSTSARLFQGNEKGDLEADADTSSQDEVKPASSYDSFAELYDAAQPKSSADKALVAGYWLQVCQESGSFDGFSANKELKNLGHGVPNITVAINALKKQAPALALQLKKSGTSKQARKQYKITVAGIKAAENMVDG